MDTLASIVRLYRGTSLSDECMFELKRRLLEKRGRDIEVCGNMYFRISEMCCCSDNCGGVFCDSITVKELCGVADIDLLMEECVTGLNIDIE